VVTPEHSASAAGTEPVNRFRLRSSVASAGSAHSRCADDARAPERPAPERLTAATAPAEVHSTPRNAQWVDPSLLVAAAVAFHDGQRTRSEAGGREARKERRTAASPAPADGSERNQEQEGGTRHGSELELAVFFGGWSCFLGVQALFREERRGSPDVMSSDIGSFDMWVWPVAPLSHMSYMPVYNHCLL
jgi:hypothetical protein